jgi:hypothetical protein
MASPPEQSPDWTRPISFREWSQALAAAPLPEPVREEYRREDPTGSACSMLAAICATTLAAGSAADCLAFTSRQTATRTESADPICSAAAIQTYGATASRD